VWSTGRVPAEWKEGIIVSLYKGKGSQSQCSSYRPISLLSVSGKVFAHILLARIQPLLDKCRRPQQSGVTAGRSTMDAILALRLLAELHRNFNRQLCDVPVTRRLWMRTYAGHWLLRTVTVTSLNAYLFTYLLFCTGSIFSSQWRRNFSMHPVGYRCVLAKICLE